MKNYGTTQESGVVLRVALTRSSGRSFFLLSVPSQFFCSLTCELDAFCCEIGRNRIPQDKASRTELPGIFLCLRALKCCTGRTYVQTHCFTLLECLLRVTRPVTRICEFFTKPNNTFRGNYSSNLYCLPGI